MQSLYVVDITQDFGTWVILYVLDVESNEVCRRSFPPLYNFLAYLIQSARMILKALLKVLTVCHHEVRHRLISLIVSKLVEQAHDCSILDVDKGDYFVLRLLRRRN